MVMTLRIVYITDCWPTQEGGRIFFVASRRVTAIGRMGG